ncbi:MAG: hypothetical protein Q8K61_12620 [Gallionella sp.]|nr:hypothetical protein [Gallionella sp.]
MTYRRYRRNRSNAGNVLSDTSYIANRLSWKGAAIFGIVLFVIFYWLIPAWINQQLNSLQGNMFRPMVEAMFAKRIHWVQWLGIALGLICAFFAIHNHFAFRRLSSADERNVGLLSRLLARWLD